MAIYILNIASLLIHISFNGGFLFLNNFLFFTLLQQDTKELVLLSVILPPYGEMLKLRDHIFLHSVIFQLELKTPLLTS